MSELTFGVILIHHRIIFTLERILIEENVELNKYIQFIIVLVISFLFSYLLKLFVANIGKPVEWIKRLLNNAVNKKKSAKIEQ